MLNYNKKKSAVTQALFNPGLSPHNSGKCENEYFLHFAILSTLKYFQLPKR